MDDDDKLVPNRTNSIRQFVFTKSDYISLRLAGYSYGYVGTSTYYKLWSWEWMAQHQLVVLHLRMRQIEIPPQIIKDPKTDLTFPINSLSCHQFRAIPYYSYFGFPATHTKIQMQLNPRYISKITHSPRKMPESSIRMRPYYIPERSRTKSENADPSNTNSIFKESLSLVGAVNTALLGAPNTTVMETCDTLMEAHPSVAVASGAISNVMRCRKLVPVKRSKSLEDVRVENLDASQPSHEMEFVSSRIQKLKVHE